MTTYLILLGLNCAAILWVYSLPILPFLKRFWFAFRRLTLTEQVKARMKPFDCETCLTGWASIIYLYSYDNLLTTWYLIPINMYLSTILVRLTR